MRSISLGKQLLVVLSVTSVSYALWTLFPGLFPHPEDFSPFSFVVAMLASLLVYTLIKDGRRRWLLLPILVFCLLALLDETGYGSEVMNIEPFYSQTWHMEVRDLHNLVTILIDLAVRGLEANHWNWSLFIQFLTFDLVLFLGASLVFRLLIRINAPQKTGVVRRRILWVVAIFILGYGLFASSLLVLLPGDPKNAFLFGYSAIRLISIIGLLALSAFPFGCLLLWNNGKNKSTGLLISFFKRNTRGLLFLLILILVVSIGYQLYAPLVFLPDRRTAIEHITPVVFWLIATCWFAILGLLGLRYYFRPSLTEWGWRLTSFLCREPAYFYALWAGLLILIAQLIDKGLLPLNKIIYPPAFTITNWELWTEESFEMVAGFLFVIAAFYFPVGDRSHSLKGHS